MNPNTPHSGRSFLASSLQTWAITLFATKNPSRGFAHQKTTYQNGFGEATFWLLPFPNTQKKNVGAQS